jgi:hypothetical protein
MTLMIKKAASVTTRPIMANVMRERAPETFDLSPPEEIHCIPPKIRKMRERITATIIIIVSALPIAFETVFKPPVGSPEGGLIVCPPGRDNARYVIHLAYKVILGKSSGKIEHCKKNQYN